MARDPENDQEAAGPARGAGAQEAPGSPGYAAPPAPTGPAGLTAADWNAVGIPVAGAPQAAWSDDLLSPTTTDLAVYPWKVAHNAA